MNYHSIVNKAAVGLAVSLLSLGAFADGKAYPGTTCSAAGTAGIYKISGGTVWNDSTTDFLTVMCPLVKDSAQIANDTTIRAFDRHTTLNVECAIVTEYTNNSSITYVDSELQTTTGFGSAVQTMNFSAQAAGNGNTSYYYADCYIPPKQNGSVSHLASLHIDEYP
jgi:hypothetical protein